MDRVRAGRLVGEDVSHGSPYAGETGQESEQCQAVSLVETRMAVTIGITARREVVVMVDMVDAVDARDGADRAKDDQVIEEVIARPVRKQPSVEAVVPDDEQAMIAGADHGKCEKHGPPAC